MNYEANTTTWRKGDFVIHDMDAKEPKMLMRVAGYSRDGLCKTQYIHREQRKTIWKNGIEFLHDPEQFGINPAWADKVFEAQRNWARVKNWNRKYPEDYPVIFAISDETTQACGKAYITQEGRGMLPIVGGRDVLLDAIVPITEDSKKWHIYWNGHSLVWTHKKETEGIR